MTNPNYGATERLTVGQAVVRFIAAQHTVADGVKRRFIPAAMGIFGHGNVAGLGQALDQYNDILPFVQGRNEQGLTHAAIGFAKAFYDAGLSIEQIDEVLSDPQMAAMLVEDLKDGKIEAGAIKDYLDTIPKRIEISVEQKLAKKDFLGAAAPGFEIDIA